MSHSVKIEPFEIDDLKFDVLPGGANEPVIHVPVITLIIGAAAVVIIDQM
jgi:hypothetical protein